MFTLQLDFQQENFCRASESIEIIFYISVFIGLIFAVMFFYVGLLLISQKEGLKNFYVFFTLGGAYNDMQNELMQHRNHRSSF